MPLLTRTTEGLTVGEVAEATGAPSAHIRHLIESGVLPATKWGPRDSDLIRVDPVDLRERLGIVISQSAAMPRAGRERISGRLRRRVMERDAYRCQECGDWHDLQLDHIVPVAKGGPNDETNLQVLCGPCNRRKGCQ